MNTLHVLHVTEELSPFTGDSDLAKESRLLCRGLSDLGLTVTVVVPSRAMADPAGRGLARRLSPLVLPGPDGDRAHTLHLHLYEGWVPGSRVQVLAVDTPPDEDATGETFSAAALALSGRGDRQPDVILASHGGENALVAFAGAGLSSAPLLLYALRGRTESPAVTRALALCDRVILPSASWAAAVRREPENHPAGQLLGPVLDKVRGVTSGVDSLDWNPRRDPYLPGGFAVEPAAHKALGKEELQRRLGLKTNPTTPLLALIGPLDPAILPYSASGELCRLGVQVVVLADAERDARCLRGLARLANQSSSSVSLVTPADPAEARAFEHSLLGAADLALFARRSTPGPLCELHCVHYGVVPIAPKEGTFADVLAEFDSTTSTGSGFLFTPSYGEQIVAAVERALRAFHKSTSHAVLVDRLMAMDLSWATAAQRYANVIIEALREKGRLAA